jgi:hypothetical protein
VIWLRRALSACGALCALGPTSTPPRGTRKTSSALLYQAFDAIIAMSFPPRAQLGQVRKRPRVVCQHFERFEAIKDHDSARRAASLLASDPISRRPAQPDARCLSKPTELASATIPDVPARGGWSNSSKHPRRREVPQGRRFGWQGGTDDRRARYGARSAEGHPLSVLGNRRYRAATGTSLPKILKHRSGIMLLIDALPREDPPCRRCRRKLRHRFKKWVL